MARVWTYFQNFVEYDDFKNLTNRILPMVAKMESKMEDYEAQHHKN